MNPLIPAKLFFQQLYVVLCLFTMVVAALCIFAGAVALGGFVAFAYFAA